MECNVQVSLYVKTVKLVLCVDFSPTGTYSTLGRRVNKRPVLVSSGPSVGVVQKSTLWGAA